MTANSLNQTMYMIMQKQIRESEEETRKYVLDEASNNLSDILSKQNSKKYKVLVRRVAVE